MTGIQTASQAAGALKGGDEERHPRAVEDEDRAHEHSNRRQHHRCGPKSLHHVMLGFRTGFVRRTLF